MKRILKYLSSHPSLRASTPKIVKDIFRKLLPMTEYNHLLWAKNNEFTGTDKEWEYKGTSNHTIGIIFDPAHYHRYYQYACVDLGFSYKVLDLRADNWIEIISKSGCDAFVIWPSLETFVLKEMNEERIYFISNYLKKPVYPSYEEIWLLNNKRRVRDWLEANGFEHPKTWCFYKKEDAYKFIENAPIPVVFKSIHEGVSRGVVICRSRTEANNLVEQCFGKGFVPRRTNPANIQKDFVLFQEYLPEVEERRMIMIGDTYIAIDKVRRGDFHSGSGTMKWSKPERYFLDTTRKVIEKGNFKSMNVDFFIAKDGRILINELHSLFRGPVIHVHENKGMYKFDQEKQEWIFAEGNYYRNYCCNLRILCVADMLNETKIDRTSWLNKPAFGL